MPKPVKIHRLWTVPINKNFVENYFFYFLKQFRYFATILIILVKVYQFFAQNGTYTLKKVNYFTLFFKSVFFVSPGAGQDWTGYTTLVVGMKKNHTFITGGKYD